MAVLEAACFNRFNMTMEELVGEAERRMFWMIQIDEDEQLENVLLKEYQCGIFIVRTSARFRGNSAMCKMIGRTNE